MGISVSRVGGNAQIKAMKKIAGMLRLDLAAFRELEAFAQMGTELDKATQNQLDRGNRIVELLKQPQYRPMDIISQVVSIYCGTTGLLDDVALNDVLAFEKQMHEYLKAHHAEILKELKDKQEMDDDLGKKLTEAINEFKKAFQPSAQAESKI